MCNSTKPKLMEHVDSKHSKLTFEVRHLRKGILYKYNIFSLWNALCEDCYVSCGVYSDAAGKPLINVHLVLWDNYNIHYGRHHANRSLTGIYVHCAHLDIHILKRGPFKNLRCIGGRSFDLKQDILKSHRLFSWPLIIFDTSTLQSDRARVVQACFPGFPAAA